MLCIKKSTFSDLVSNINNASIQIRKISKLDTITLKIKKDNLKKKKCFRNQLGKHSTVKLNSKNILKNKTQKKKFNKNKN